MREQQILWNILMLAMLAGAIYAAWEMGRFEIGIVMSSAASERSLVPVAKPVGQEEQSKAKKAKTPKAHSAKDCPLCCAEGLGTPHECQHHELRKYDHSTWRKLIPWRQCDQPKVDPSGVTAKDAVATMKNATTGA